MENIGREKALDFLEYLYSVYNKKEYIHSDPIRFPHELEGCVEFIAFTASAFAYGNMKAIQGFLRKYFNYAGTVPSELNCNIDSGIYYRFQKSSDMAAYSFLMKEVYSEYGSLGNLFHKAGADSIDTVDKGIILLRSHIRDMTGGLNFLIPVPGKSASKRLYMFLRWMVRKDEVDFGLWEHFDKTGLYMPSDTHILRMAHNLGIIDKNENNKKAVLKVTDFFKNLNPQDPAKYDFALTRLGIISGCRYSESDICANCPHKKICLFR